MNADYQIPEPLLFNPLKHHLGFIKEFINLKIEDESNTLIKNLIKELKHLGTSVMDVYTGSLSVVAICTEIEIFLQQKNLLLKEPFKQWAGISMNNFRIITLSDDSQWAIKYHNSTLRYIHFFPARPGMDGSRAVPAFRVKSNTLKSALLYLILIGKDFISGDDLNKVRPLLGLSPVKDSVDTEAILEMIEILRG